jgi:hypothetical protein
MCDLPLSDFLRQQCRLFAWAARRQTLRLKLPKDESGSMNGSVTPGYYFSMSWFLKRCSPKQMPRPSSSRIPMTSLRSVPPNLLKSRAVAPISKSAMSRSLAYLLTMLSHTTSGSLTSTSGERPTSSTLLYVVQMIWGRVSPTHPPSPRRLATATGRLRRSMTCLTTRMRATSTRRDCP